jgi:hypothetical protein
MRRSWLAVPALVATLGCASEPAGPVCAAVASTADLTTPKVSLRSDLLPIFAPSCAFSACHGGKPTDSNNGVYLGSATGTTDAVAVRTALLATSKTIDMPYVTPGDPAKSYLMHKMDGDQCTLATRCSGGSCGAGMPSGGPLLEVAKRDTVRRWIAQGAQDN